MVHHRTRCHHALMHAFTPPGDRTHFKIATEHFEGMRAKGSKAARTKRAGNGAGSSHADSCPLLELPVEVLHQVLGLLNAQDLIKLLQTSKALAQEVMQHRAGQLTLSVGLCRGCKLAAIKQLLQWAPPSSLKLMFDGYCGDPAYSVWGALSSLFDPPCAVPQSQHRQQMQQFSCISDVHIKGFRLPSLVPAGLAAMCPNMRTLHLSCILSVGSDGSSKEGSSKAASSSASTEGACCTSLFLHTLILDATQSPSLQELSGVQQAEQVRSSLPKLTCLKLLNCLPEQLSSTLGPQLKELHLAKLRTMPLLPIWGMGLQLPQLQKLVLPDTKVRCAADIGQLLSLPNLTHLEVDSVLDALATDYSSHACKWQYLHLHLRCSGLSVDSLAKLPLHSLTKPIKLGNTGADCMEVSLPISTKQDSLPTLERLAQQLMRCGVHVVGDHVSWEGEDLDTFPTGAELAPSLSTIAPLLGQPPHVTLQDMEVDLPILQALVTAYGSGLKHLDFVNCAWEEDSLPLWRLALSGLPSLAEVTLRADGDEVKLTRTLAEAMAEQPAGRSIQLVAYDMPHPSSHAYAARVMDGAEERLAGVDITAASGMSVPPCRFYDACLHITSKQMP